MFFIHWDTNVRVRELGERADFCPGCLQVSRFLVQAVEQSTRIYLVPLGYREVKRIQECAICGTVISCRLDESFEKKGRLPFPQLLAATNPGLTDERVAAIEAALGENGDADARREKSLECFLRRQTDVLSTAMANVAFSTAMVGLALLALCIAAFVFASPVCGGVTCVLSAWLGLWFHRRMGHRSAAKVIRPRLSRFLAAHGIWFTDFEADVRRKGHRYRRLVRHLSSGRYDELRMQMGPPRGDVFRGTPRALHTAAEAPFDSPTR